ncbi:MAG: Flp pilus assembly protein CpaB [Candidatus Wallbacteria bacterium]|nr:Flp pilus assembly protein CpaB [Candidatus Wallbacteria bacterium]
MGRKNRMVMIIIVGIIGWVLASMMGWTGDNGKKKKDGKQSAKQPAETVEIQVVKKEVLGKVVQSRCRIEKGEVIGLNHVVLLEIPKKEIQRNTCSEIEGVIGKVAIENIEPDVQIMEKQLLDTKKIQRFSFHVPNGMRAVSLKVANPQHVLSGLIEQYDHVDVIAVFDNSKDVDTPFAKTIIQNAQVLAVGTEFSMDAVETPGEPSKSTAQKSGGTAPAATAAVKEEPAKNASAKSSQKSGSSSKKGVENVIEGKKIDFVTLAVKPEDAESIALITKRAEFFLTLRFPFDAAVTDAKGTAQPDVLGFMRREELIQGKDAEIRIKENNLKVRDLIEREKQIEIYRGLDKSGKPAASGTSRSGSSD